MNRLEQFLDRLRCHDTAICMEGDGKAYTYAQLLREVECWQSRLHDSKIEAGSVVGLRADYSLYATAALLALVSHRLVVALIPLGRSHDQYLEDARTTALIDMEVDGNYEWRATPPPEGHPLLDRLRSGGNGGLVLFTSGTNGKPKAALHNFEGFLSKFDRPGRCLRTLAFLLFDHVAGQDTLFYTLSAGGTLVLTRKRDPVSIAALMESHRVEVLPTSPSFLRLFCSTNAVSENDLSQLKIITYGSEPMDPSTLARMNTRCPHIQMSQKYGVTEAGSPRSKSKGNDSLWLKFNRDGVEVKAIDDVLWIRSEGLIMGYLNAPFPVDTEGWYCTGDLVDVDGEWFRFRGRKTDVINVGGEKVAPAEVEHVILELEFVLEAVVTGVPHPLLGQVVTATVRLGMSDMTSREAITRIWQHCRLRLARFKAPVKIHISNEQLVSDRQKTVRNQRAND